MYSRAEHYRRVGIEAQKSAAKAIEPKTRAAFEEIATGWFALAEQVEWLDRQHEREPRNGEEATSFENVCNHGRDDGVLMVASAGITLGERTGWFSTLRWRYISSRPLTEDGVFQAPPVNTINGRLGYQFSNGWRVQLDALISEEVDLSRGCAIPLQGSSALAPTSLVLDRLGLQVHCLNVGEPQPKID